MTNKIKISIGYEITDNPWGGGNQFLKGLKQEFIRCGVYENDFNKADIILFNSHHNLRECFKIKKRNNAKIILHRIDGPIDIVRSKDKPIDKVIKIDRIIKLFNDLFSDGTIFQSNWSKEQNKRLFDFSSKYESVIHNAPDNNIFNRAGKSVFDPKAKIRLISTAWSSDWHRGFDLYKFLDERLDFSRFDMTFVGNSPVEFKNIRVISPVISKELAGILKTHDIYITADKSSACSNSLIEAMCCGLPAVASENSSYPELIGKGGLLFKGKDDIIEKIEQVSANYRSFQSGIPEYSIKNVASEYYNFAVKIYDDRQAGRYQTKKFGFLSNFALVKLNCMILKWKILSRVGFLNKIKRFN
jgi:glycosyltransferase involved in cell wall biosynthesis